nr:immunoglobulin heavy chain junction region [Macaca mulatta]MOV41344.1 immunoglobulin heavy chain junction region [Macaca mulatta]MOV41648.1 immunoglobulin heavy chain junction region [Macaca mulatta]MOV42179.1 immunoglobulin heavy chain junction region [Macaca mulatta]MOV43128.1 immunoglobulin heavy chain junction region [Macaca mulatta]
CTRDRYSGWSIGNPYSFDYW